MLVVIMGAMTLAGGVFLFLWYRTVVALPASRQPRFIHAAGFKWGVPAINLLLAGSGLFLLGQARMGAVVAGAAGSVLVVFLFLRFDRYSAVARIIFDRYCRIRRANPGMEDMEVLFHTARWRYPSWDHDRLVELVAGKDIEALILLMLISENTINPITDWELYRTVKRCVTRVVHKTK